VRVTIVGTGYVGLVTGACLADAGHQVTCVDVDESRVEAIERGEAFLYEPGLQEVLDRVAGTRLRGTVDLAAAVRGSEITMLAVGTPSNDGRIDLGYVEAASRQVGEALRDHDAPHVVVVKSTVVPGTTSDVVGPIVERASGRRIGEDLGLGMNPEFLREGNAVQDFVHPDRIVLGVADAMTEAKLRELYAPFACQDVVVTNPRTAEAVKYASNAVLATLISFSNEIGNLVARLPDVDVRDVMAGVHLDRRWSPILADGQRVRPGIVTYLEAGCGFGGSCFPKDVAALAAFGSSLGADVRMLNAVLDINAAQPDEVLGLLRRGLGALAGQRVAVLGVAFKPGTDDVRESPALRLIAALVAEGADVTAFDPEARETARKVLDPRVALARDLEEAVARAEAVVLMTSWPEFVGLADLLADRADPPLVVDGRRMLRPSDYARYEGIGLGPRSR
jgi:UDPglucose 6-dehydrogenase